MNVNGGIDSMFQVCEYAIATYSEASVDAYQRLLVVWVQCKQLLQQSVHPKTLDIPEVSD